MIISSYAFCREIDSRSPRSKRDYWLSLAQSACDWINKTGFVLIQCSFAIRNIGYNIIYRYIYGIEWRHIEGLNEIVKLKTKNKENETEQASKTKTIKTENNQIKSNDANERANAFPPFTSTLWTLNWIWLIDNHSKVPSVAAALFCCKPISCLQQLTPHSYPPRIKAHFPQDESTYRINRKSISFSVSFRGTLHSPIRFTCFFANHSNQIQFQTNKIHFDWFSYQQFWIWLAVSLFNKKKQSIQH